MSGRDVRPQILATALRHPDLSDGHRLFLIMVTSLATEYVDGKPRKGSRGMDRHGRFSLHYDYLGRALHKTPGNVKKMAQRLAADGFLDKVHPGTYGRPATWHALTVRGDTHSRITFRLSVPPYDPEGTPPRGDTVSPLTYRTPDHSDHAPAVGDSPTTAAEVSAARSKADTEHGSHSGDACQWHRYVRCPDDCANLTRDHRRTTA